MPLYEYRCESCDRTIEVIQSFADKPLRKCEACGGKLRKLVSRSGFVLKGSGWYASDYKPAPSSSKGADDASPAKDAGTPEPAKTEKAPKKREKSKAGAD